MGLLNLASAPSDPVERIMWLTGVMKQAKAELGAELQACYFEARMTGRLDDAIAAGPVGRKRALQMTRAENEKRGRMVRWGDGADATSSAYRRSSMS